MIKYFCLFIGYPRSGHSIVGALLDAHPNIAISHELDVMEFIYHNNSKESIFKKIIKSSENFAKKGSKAKDNIYTYPVEGQGVNCNIKVLGDKKGGGTSEWIKNYPHLTDQLHKIIDLPIKFIHVVRNPFDNISTMVLRHKGKINEKIKAYFEKHNSGVSICKSKIEKENWLTIHQENFIKMPKNVLTKICSFLKQDVTNDYLQKCVKIVKSKPHETRFKINWTEEQKNTVKKLNQKYDYLRNYSF